MTSAYDIVDANGNPGHQRGPVGDLAEGVSLIAELAADPVSSTTAASETRIGVPCGTKDISGPPLCSAPPDRVRGPSIRVDRNSWRRSRSAISLVHRRTTRTVTNAVVEGRDVQRPRPAAPAGVIVTVSPSSPNDQPRPASKTFAVAFLDDRGVTTYVGGHLTCSDGTHNVRIPMAVQLVKFKAPPEAGHRCDRL